MKLAAIIKAPKCLKFICDIILAYVQEREDCDVGRMFGLGTGLGDEGLI